VRVEKVGGREREGGWKGEERRGKKKRRGRKQYEDKAGVMHPQPKEYQRLLVATRI
jgi:hypothetical protein